MTNRTTKIRFEEEAEEGSHSGSWSDQESFAGRDDIIDSSSAPPSSWMSLKTTNNHLTIGGGGTNSSNNSTNEMNDIEEIQQMVKKESRDVRVWRRNVYITIIVAAGVVIGLTYWFLLGEGQQDFETAFNEFALTIQHSTEFNLQGVIQGTSGLSEILSSEASKTNSEWPFMTLSSFEVYVRNTRTQASSELVIVAPIVTAENLDEWTVYSTEHQGWIDESFEAYPDGTARPDLNPIPSSVYRFGRFRGRTVLKPEDGAGKYPTAPFWQMSRPPFDTSIVNFNSLSMEAYQQMYDDMMSSRRWVMGVAGPNTLIDYTISQEAHDELHSETSQQILKDKDNDSSMDPDSPSIVLEEKVAGFANDHPHTALVYPVFEELSNHESDIVAFVINILPWDNYLKSVLPDGVNGIHCVLHNDAGQSFTYLIRGEQATYVGFGDWHDTAYDEYEFVVDFDSMIFGDGSNENEQSPNQEQKSATTPGVSYWFAIYPTSELENDYQTTTPVIFVIVACGAAFIAVTFILYDRLVSRKNNKIQDAAARSNAILSSLFPQDIKRRLLEDRAKDNSIQTRSKRDGEDDGGLESFWESKREDKDILPSKPIADLFPDTTVMFADLVGFTAWSSSREPTAVFVLLETLYRAFDRIAKTSRIYKVETIGDCYVAVAGLPEPRADHALAMGRFASDCLHKMHRLTNKLEVHLGPGTSSLNMRIGLHSGSVTAGVLRGERSRFQLFGSTMNIASRVESHGQEGRIHLSQSTADEYFAADKGHLLERRQDRVVAKGVGEMQTYWLMNKSGGAMNQSGYFGPERDHHFAERRSDSLIQWNVDRFARLLKQIVASREKLKDFENEGSSSTTSLSASISPNDDRTSLPLDEVKEVIDLPSWEGLDDTATSQSFETISLDPTVHKELETYITYIARMYADHPFHNFDHASHVIMSVIKLMSRFESSGFSNSGTRPENDGFSNSFLSDPLTRFACAFSALIHDVQHPGVPNQQLIKEDPELAKQYKQRSIAEQRSFNIAWDKLMDDEFANLRSAIYQTRVEEERFRQLVVNSIMATDIMDKDLKQLRNNRWDKAFAETRLEDGTVDAKKSVHDRKATIMLEHLIQASDVSHTMQHWKVYLRWNERLFEEMYQAFLDGRSEKDPTEFWYKGEIGFLDFYVIPLAKRLKEVGRYLGVPGDEYLEFAKSNRREWEEKGERVVADMKYKILNNKHSEEKGLATRRVSRVSMDGSIDSTVHSTRS